MFYIQTKIGKRDAFCKKENALKNGRIIVQYVFEVDQATKYEKFKDAETDLGNINNPFMRVFTIGKM